MKTSLLAALVILAPAAARAEGVKIGFPGDGRIHVEWQVAVPPAGMLERVKAWKADGDLRRGKQLTCAIGEDSSLTCAFEIDHAGKVRASPDLVAFGEVAHPIDPITGTVEVGDHVVIGGTAGLLVWAWLDRVKDRQDSRASKQLHCRDESAAGGKVGATCGLRFDAKGRVRAADPL